MDNEPLSSRVNSGTVLAQMLTKMGQVKVTQVKSAIDRSKRQKDTLKALGLRKMHQTVTHNATPQILGMIKKVNHLIEVEHLA